MRREIRKLTDTVSRGYWYVARGFRNQLGRGRKGSAEIVILLLIIVVGVGLVSLFKTQITSVLNMIFTKVSAEITNTLIKEPTIN